MQSNNNKQIPNIIPWFFTRENAECKYNPEGIKNLGGLLKKHSLTISVGEQVTQERIRGEDIFVVTPRLIVSGDNLAVAEAIQAQLDRAFNAAKHIPDVDGWRKTQAEQILKNLKVKDEDLITDERIEYRLSLYAQISQKQQYFFQAVVDVCNDKLVDENAFVNSIGEGDDSLSICTALRTKEERLEAFNEAIGSMSQEAKNCLFLEDHIVAMTKGARAVPRFREFILENHFLNQSGYYNLNMMLESTHVLASIASLLETSELQASVFIIPAVAGREEERSKALHNAFIELQQDKTVILPISNNGHWITLVMKPNSQNPAELFAYSMDSMGGCKLAKDVLKELKVIADNHGHTINKMRNCSQNGQQIRNCCGVATILNSITLVKTLQEKGVNFTDEHLFANVAYCSKDGYTYVMGEKMDGIRPFDIVARIGGILLRQGASDDFKDGRPPFVFDKKSASIVEIIPYFREVEKNLHAQYHTQLEAQLEELNAIAKDENGKKVLKYVLEREISYSKESYTTSTQEFFTAKKRSGEFKELFEILEAAKPEVSWGTKLAVLIYNIPLIGKAMRHIIENCFNEHTVLDVVKAVEKFQPLNRREFVSAINGGSNVPSITR